MREVALAALACVLGVAPAAASAQELGDWGDGSHGLSREPDYHASLPEALGLPELFEADGDVFRFSSAPVLGNYGYAITLSELPDSSGRIEAILVRGHNVLGWKRIAAMQATISAEAYAEVSATLDGLYRPPERFIDRDDPDRTILLCTDGPGFLSERNRDGEITWLEGYCADDHPNRAISRVMRDLARSAFAGAWDNVSAE